MMKLNQSGVEETVTFGIDSRKKPQNRDVSADGSSVNTKDDKGGVHIVDDLSSECDIEEFMFEPE